MKKVRKDGKIMISGCQFPLMSAIGLIPLALQCMTISGNTFYDYSRFKWQASPKNVSYTQ